MKRSRLTEQVKALANAGKSDYEISVQLGIDLTTARNRMNYLIRKGELSAKRASRDAFIKLADSEYNVPVEFAKTAYAVAECDEAALRMLELWVSQSGCCALTGRPFSDSPPTRPVIVSCPSYPVCIVSASANRLRGTMPLNAFISLCKLVASRCT